MSNASVQQAAERLRKAVPVYFRKPTVCETGSYCARPSSARSTKSALWTSLILVLAALTIDWWAPLLY